MKIIGFSGKFGSGKDYLADCLVAMLAGDRRYVRLALADFFKIEAVGKGGLPFSEVFGQKTERSRALLQRLGTEEGREVYGEDIWSRILNVQIQLQRERIPDLEFVLVTDIRFPSEIAALRTLPDVEAVYIVRVIAPQRHEARVMQESRGDEATAARLRSHKSEIALDDYQLGFDLVLQNDPHEDAITPLRDFVQTRLGRAPAEHTVFIDLDDTICECQKHYDTQAKLAGQLFGHYFPDNRFAATARFTRCYIESRADFEKDTFSRERFGSDLRAAAQRALEEGEEFRLADEHLESNLLRHMVEIGMTVHKAPFNALPGAVEAVRRLRRERPTWRLVIFTMGERADQLRKLWQLGLGRELPCEVFIRKDFTTFRILMQRWPAARYTMIGDSLSRDITPAQQAGIQRTIQITKDRSLANAVEELLQQ